MVGQESGACDKRGKIVNTENLMTTEKAALPIPPIFGEAARRLFRTITSRHDFRLDAMSLGEAYRMRTFLQNADLSKYPDLADLGEKLFLTAQLSCLREIEACITKAEQTT